MVQYPSRRFIGEIRSVVVIHAGPVAGPVALIGPSRRRKLMPWLRALLPVRPIISLIIH